MGPSKTIYGSIGPRIKERRVAAGMSLRRLAERADLTASFLSQVERGQAQPSIVALRRIADALGAGIASFLVDPSDETPVVRGGSRPRLTFPDNSPNYELLTTHAARRIEAFVGRIAPGTGNFARPLREPTEECILVLSGTIRIVLATGEFVLESGDSICFEGALLREMSNAGEDEAVWISMITPPVF